MANVSGAANRWLMGVVLGMAALGGTSVSAQERFPDKPVRAIIPFPAGGSTDTAMRVIANDLGQELGQPVIVENRGGGGGIIGINAGAKSPADGYTVVMVANSYATNFTLRNDLPYKPGDLAPVALIGVQPSVLVVRPSLGVKTIEELIALGKQRPLTYASFGSGTTPHMAGETFKMHTGIQATHVAYRGESQGLQDLLAGNIDMMFGTLSIMMPHVEQSKLVALAVGTTSRSVAAPQLRTVRELLKLERFNFDSWFGIMVPAATPPDRIKVLSEAFRRTLARPSVQEALLKRGVEPVPGGGNFDAFLSRNVAEYSDVIRKAKITLD